MTRGLTQRVFRAINRIGNSVPRPARRLLLDRLGLARLLGRLARGSIDTITLPSGHCVTINPLLHAEIARDGALVYEDDVLDALMARLGPGDVFYDIGANIGVFSIMAAARLGESGAVHAFEPEENNLACFRRTMAEAGFTTLSLHAMALGAESGTMTFDRRGGAFSGRLLEGGAGAEGETTDVPVRAIDDLVVDGLDAPTLVKVDVEGGEGAVLEGMARTLAEHRPAVLIEFHAFNPEGVERACAVLAAAGYVLHGLAGAPVAPGATIGAGLPRHVIATPA